MAYASSSDEEHFTPLRETNAPNQSTMIGEKNETINQTDQNASTVT